jgi:DNA-directed RNA polymerase subunit M/transcription elongation factor TFIIS
MVGSAVASYAQTAMQITPSEGSRIYPARCPRCGALAGMPFAAGTKPHDETIDVSVRCGVCSHEWHADVQSPMPTQRPSAAS